jgi:RsiW-degrading membrane proteinase PrsW (M82 family)
MTHGINALILAFLSTAFWFCYLRRLNFRRSNLLIVSVAAVATGASVAYYLLGLLQAFTPIPYPVSLSWGQLFVNYLVRAGLLEETVKAVAALLFLRAVKTEWDGMFLGSCCALGLAAAENFSYLYNVGEWVALSRFFLTPLGHVLVSAFWASRLKRGMVPFIGGFALAVFVHTAYNILVKVSGPLALPLVLLLFILFLRRAEALRSKAYSLSSSEVTNGACLNCREPVTTVAQYCSRCGVPCSVSGEPREIRDRSIYAVVLASLLFVATHTTKGMYGIADEIQDQGAELAGGGHLEESEQLLRQGLERFPDDQRMAHYLVTTLMKQEKWSQAKPILEDLLNSKVDSWFSISDPLELNYFKVSLLNLAEVQFRLGEEERALSTLDTLLAEGIPPDFRAESLALRAEVFYAQGHFQKSLSDIETAVSLAPKEKETNEFLKVLKDCPDQEVAQAARNLAAKP